jgi:transposase-like protein
VKTRSSAPRWSPVCSAEASGRRPAAACWPSLDGAAALQTAVLTLWPTAVIQRCLVHKERNLFGYLRKGDQAEARRLWRRLRLAQGEAAGREALAALQAFLAPLNAAASASLAEAGDQLIALHKLNVPGHPPRLAAVHQRD